MAVDLKTYMENVEIGLQYKCTSIPNLLIIGSSGTGKSVLAHAIAEKLQASYVSICEADLEPLGINASYYLRNLFQSKYGASLWEQKKKPFLIIIDGADLLIKPRKPKFISKSSKSVSPRGTPHAYEGSKGSAIDDQVCSNCLYTLLNEMKVASPHVSLIITTNRSVGAIDSAILNRTDSILVLTKPSQLQRLRYILYNLPINVGQFLDDETIKIVSDASLVQYLRSMNTNKSNEITNQLVRSIVNNIKKQSNNDPETDRPASLNLKVVTAPVATTNSFDSYSNTTFELEICISKFVIMTDGWSFRELEKFLLSLRQEILSISYVDQDSKLVLTSMVFMKTLDLVGNSNNSDK
jgi:SpoVK/Ycf46/Vps4 family AAA+-type ATPase